MSTRIQTANYRRLTRKYFSEVIEPVIKTLEQAGPPIEQRLSIADINFTIKNFGVTLAEKQAPAFAHLPPPSTDDTDLTVYAWDSVGTGTQIVSPWSSREYLSVGTDLQQAPEDGFIGVFHHDGTITLYDSKHKRAYFWINDATTLPVWLFAAPLRTLLQWVLEEKDIHLVHGAVVAEANNGVLITAKGGSGKSTTSLSCLRAGMQYLADDYVAVSREAAPRAYSLYNSVKLAPYLGIDFDPAHITETEGEKSVVFLSSLFPKQMTPSVPLKAIMIPRITHRETTSIVPATKAEAMLALVPTTLFQLPLAGTNKVQMLSSIVSALPCYTVELGKDSMEAARVIKEFMRTSF